MEDFSWFCSTIKNAVAQNDATAKLLQQVLEGKTPEIDRSIFKTESQIDALETVIENGLALRKTEAGKKELRKLIRRHRHSAGYRTDDIALRYAYRQWIDQSRDRVKLMRHTRQSRNQ